MVNTDTSMCNRHLAAVAGRGGASSNFSYSSGVQSSGSQGNKIYIQIIKSEKSLNLYFIFGLFCQIFALFFAKYWILWAHRHLKLN